MTWFGVFERGAEKPYVTIEFADVRRAIENNAGGMRMGTTGGTKTYIRLRKMTRWSAPRSK
jgi:hypothetical protein